MSEELIVCASFQTPIDGEYVVEYFIVPKDSAFDCTFNLHIEVNDMAINGSLVGVGGCSYSKFNAPVKCISGDVISVKASNLDGHIPNLRVFFRPTVIYKDVLVVGDRQSNV